MIGNGLQSHFNPKNIEILEEIESGDIEDV